MGRVQPGRRPFWSTHDSTLSRYKLGADAEANVCLHGPAIVREIIKKPKRLKKADVPMRVMMHVITSILQ